MSERPAEQALYLSLIHSFRRRRWMISRSVNQAGLDNESVRPTPQPQSSPPIEERTARHTIPVVASPPPAALAITAVDTTQPIRIERTMEYTSDKEKPYGPGEDPMQKLDEESGSDGIDEFKSPPPSPTKPTGPPNGGLKAWMQVLGSFFIYFNTWGLVASFGTFQVYYEGHLLKEHSSFAISTIGSLQSFLMVFLGLFAGPIFDLGYAKQLLWVGTTLIVTGSILQSLSHNLWQLLLTQGLCVGIGQGSLAVLGVAILSPWFTTKLPMATGIAAAGSGVGGLVLPILFRSIQPEIGFRWTVRTMALIALTTLSISIVTMEPPKPSAFRRPLIDRTAFKDAPYLLFVAACCLVFLGMYTPFVYIPGYALARHAVSTEIDKYLLAILNGASIVGRTVPILFTAQLGRMNMLIVAVAALSISAFCLSAVTHTPALLVTVIFYGTSSGAFFSLQPATFSLLTEDKKYIGTRLGMAYAVMSVALLLGSPVGGALVRSVGYISAWIWAGVTLGLGSITIACSRGMATKWDWKKTL
ncbi:major facilitator superfamily transporter [Colletotrichum lupini]|uniref:Major facilitator superfamily transporter n=1 Tax=Colletotrichum lupini TaxID=145971 RepID=A0A9Q8W9M9_9PEZI|nr:major facilitator superfamily transporter [Colletotrichum lupini]UQC75156.1 major facilitator superfamily transporter [Colletotrichum lupini]